MASPAIARAISVLPTPGGPASSTPLGGRTPVFANMSGSFRNDTISSNSATVPSIPATSSSVTPVVPSLRAFALDCAYSSASCTARHVSVRIIHAASAT